MVKVEKYVCCLCLNLLFKLLPWQVAAACPYPRKWNHSYPIRCLTTVRGHRSLRTPATRTNKFTEIAPALIISWNTRLSVGNRFTPFWTGGRKSSSLSSTLSTSLYQTCHQEDLFNQQKIPVNSVLHYLQVKQQHISILSKPNQKQNLTRYYQVITRQVGEWDGDKK